MECLIQSGALVTAHWAAPGFVDTEIGVTLEPEDDHGTEKDLQPRVQARGGEAGTRSRRVGRTGGTRSGYPRELAT